MFRGWGCDYTTPDGPAPVARVVPQTPRTPVEPNEIVETMDEDGKGIHLAVTNPAGKKFHASIGDEVEIPDAFPDDVPIFPEATPMASMSAPDEGIIVTFKSGEEQQEIFDFYQSNLEGDGWEILKDSMAGNKFSIDAVKDSRKVSVIIAGTEGDSRVSVIVTPRN
jgi:hypothetical protein